MSNEPGVAAGGLPRPTLISPLNAEFWSYYLLALAYEDTYFGWHFYSFSLSIIDGETSSAKDNYLSAYLMPKTIDDYLAKELS